MLLSAPSSDFSGGGTYFDHPLNYTRQPASMGGCLVHCGKRRHAGNAITRGTRYLLVGFVDEQRHRKDSLGSDENSRGDGSSAEATAGHDLNSSAAAAYAQGASIELHFQDHS